ncbi:unnamed protein product [Vitrella brassicaformis CCMP3155]|uniref:Uncharacterized protein n=1 Tax=Vitrella brassicaformis (strain CCMP3155) TaxID=1169540 RepID=A0A0G4GNZ8_VITBC|nr:unnamed protein product [Vitrella brassicaformis CCMP3155]|eukprot:CEM32006.1 unnamed protein product [Vitrella brassicaformis CCMP3155]
MNASLEKRGQTKIVMGAHVIAALSMTFIPRVRPVQTPAGQRARPRHWFGHWFVGWQAPLVRKKRLGDGRSSAADGWRDRVHKEWVTEWAAAIYSIARPSSQIAVGVGAQQGPEKVPESAKKRPA